MCGICGVCYSDTSHLVSLDALKRMTKSLEHRGPDDEGFYLNNNVGLGHRRLAILDLSPAGHQPMANRDHSLWITFNGEIYNYIELRNDLEKRGYSFSSQSDTEVILCAFEEWGERCVQFLNGMFAFAIWDTKKKRLFCARDRVGIKPFYFFSTEKEFIFASEIKALLAYGVKAKPNLAALNEYLTFQFYFGDKTLFEGVKQLEPGYILLWSHGRVRVKQYWDISYDIRAKRSERQTVEELAALVEDAVRIQLRSDVPVGTHLSGGIDTTIVALLASRLVGPSSRIKTFCGAFHEGSAYNETSYASIAAKAARALHFEIFPSVDEFIETMPRLIYAMDQPAGGPGLFPQYMVSSLAAQHVKVVLGGQGGDEVWGGYARYLIAYFEQALKGAIWNHQEEGKYVVTLRSVIPNLKLLKEYTPLLQFFWKEGLFGPMDERYLRLMRRFESHEEVFQKEFLEELRVRHLPTEEFKRIFNTPDTPSYVNKMTYFDLKVFLPTLLQVEDRASMAVSLESRVPLLDHRILELSARVPPMMKMKGGASKYLLKRAFRDIIPKKILEREDKIGFAVPLNEWYKQPKMKAFLREILLSKRARERGIYNIDGITRLFEREQKFGRQAWGLICLELWFRTFIDDHGTKPLF